MILLNLSYIISKEKKFDISILIYIIIAIMYFGDFYFYNICKVIYKRKVLMKLKTIE